MSQCSHTLFVAVTLGVLALDLPVVHPSKTLASAKASHLGSPLQVSNHSEESERSISLKTATSLHPEETKQETQIGRKISHCLTNRS